MTIQYSLKLASVGNTSYFGQVIMLAKMLSSLFTTKTLNVPFIQT